MSNDRSVVPADARSGWQIEEWLREAARVHASDFHAAVGAAPMLRIDGQLVRVSGDKLTAQTCLAFACDVLGEELARSLELRGEADAAYALPDGLRCRVHVYRQRSGLSLAVRLIPAAPLPFAALGLPPQIEQFADWKQGLVLFTGPTGCGKSTTLAAVVDSINHRLAKHIVTLEDPIEFWHRDDLALIEQRQVGVDTESFATGLRSVLRQDPDVIVVGEMRDLDTIATAITAAETGHLVFATLHTPDAVQTIDRMVDVFPSSQQAQIRTQLAGVLAGIVSQRLLPARSGEGRVAVCEVLTNTPAVANLIRTGQAHQVTSVMQTGRPFGMQTMDMHLRELRERGLIAPDAAIFA